MNLENLLQQAGQLITELQAQVQTQAAQIGQTAQQRPMPATPAFSPIVDTRMLTKPKAFSGKDEDWAGWVVVTRAYCGALDRRLLEEMANAEMSADMQINTDMTEDEQQRSCTLYFLLAMLVEGRAQSMVTNCQIGRAHV